VARSRRSTLVIALVALGVAALAAVAVLVIGAHREASSSATGTSSVALGGAVFQSGLGPNGVPIPRSESQSQSSGGGMMGSGVMGGGMMRLSCASCHGVGGHGLATQEFTSPNITYSNLSDPKGMLAPDGTRGPTYSDASLRRAITTGIDPSGGQLAWPMPQWQLTGQEWHGLLAYLKTLR
jgi:hypothetical protein